MVREATGVVAPDDSFSELADRLVETGIPWNTPAPTFANLAPRTPDSRRCGTGAASRTLEHPRRSARSRSRSSATEAIAICREVLREQIEAWDLRSGQSARDRADERHAVRAEIEQVRCEQPADHEHQRSRNFGAPKPQCEDHGEGDERRRATVVQLHRLPSPRIQEASSRQRGITVGGCPGQLRATRR